MTVEKILEELDALAAETAEGPVFISDDEAKDTTAHRNAGLAMLDTGRQSDWPIARLQEWNEARFYAALRNYYPKLRAALQAREGWISVADRMPEDGTECLVVIKAADGSPFVSTDTWQMQRECPVSFSSHTIETGMAWDNWEFEDITHWMPLPAAPAADAGE